MWQRELCVCALKRTLIHMCVYVCWSRSWKWDAIPLRLRPNPTVTETNQADTTIAASSGCSASCDPTSEDAKPSPQQHKWQW